MRSRAPLIDPYGVRAGPFVAALGTSFITGAALMVTLVDVPLVAQTLLGKGSVGGALVLARFLVALPVGAVAGGMLAARFGERRVGMAGLVASALGFWLVSGWPLHALAARHQLGPVSLPRVDVDLAL